jgi:hypothetical protein
MWKSFICALAVITRLWQTSINNFYAVREEGQGGDEGFNNVKNMRGRRQEARSV